MLMIPLNVILNFVELNKAVYGKYFYDKKLMTLCQHFHPTVNKFANDILDNPEKQIEYAGNPLLDF